MKHKTSLIKIKQFFIRNTRLFFYYLFNLSKKAKKNFKKFSFRKTVKFVIKLPSLVKRFFSPRKVKRFFRNYFTLEKIVNSIRKLFAIRKFRRSFAAFVFAMLVFQYFFPIIPFLPTIPFSPNEKRTVNADINEAEANDNAMFVNVNPEFKVEFGDRNDETLHRVRFEADPSVENPFASKTSDKIKENILEKVKNKLFPTEKGIEFSLVSAQLEGDIVMDQEASNVVQNNDTPLVDNESGTEEELSDNSTNEDVSSQKSAEELALENMKRELSESAEKLKSQMSDDEIDKKSQELTKLITEAREVYAKTELSEDDGTNVVTNPEVIPGVDVKYKILEGLGVKEDIVINRLDSYDADCIQKAIEEGKTDPENFNCQMPKNSYTFNLKLDPGVEVHQAIGSLGGLPNGTYYFTDSNGKYLFHFLTPYAVDARDRKTNDVKIEVSKVEQNQNSLISKIVNPEENLQNSGYAIESISSLGEKVKNVFGNIAKADDEDQNNLENAGSSSQIDQEEASSNQIEPETQAASENEGEERAPMTEFKKLVGQNQTEYQVKITVDPTWLLDSTRAYPITIDPSIVHDTEAEFDTGDSLNRVESIAGPKVQIHNPNGGNDQYTKLLLHSDGTNGSTAFSDSSYVANQRKVISVSGNTQISTSQSKFGDSSAYFDGSGDYLTVSDSEDWSFGSGDFAFDTWVNFSSLSSIQNIFYQGSGDSSNYRIQLYYHNTVGLSFNILSGGSYLVDFNQGSISGWSTDNWYHIAVVRNGNIWNLYRNGISIASTSANITSPNYSGPFYIGGNETGSSNLLSGYLDELRISKGIARWTGDFTPPERAYDYQKNYGVYTSSPMELGETATSIDSLQWTENGVQTGDGETPYSSTSLVGSWNFNETSGTSATDSSGNGHTGTLTNFSSTGSQDAVLGSGWTANNRRWGTGALTFDGSNDYVSLSPTGFDFAAGTIEFWMKSDEDGWGDAIGFDSSGYPNQLFIGTKESGKAAFLCNIGNNYNAYVDIPNGDWHHWALVVNDSGNKIYRDGIQVTPTYDTGDASKNCFLDDISPTSFNFGIRGTDSAHPFKGSLDAVRIYSRALSAEEILSDYQVGNIEFQTRTGNTSTPNDGTWEDWKPAEGITETQFESEDNAYLYDTQDSSLVSYWPMDETADNSCSGGTNDVCDKKGTSDGAATGTKIVDGKFGKGRYFDGTDDYVSVPDNSNFEFGSGQFAISYWFKVDSLGTYAVLWKGDPSTSFSPYAFQLDSSGNMYLYMSSSGSSWDVAQSRIIATGITAGRWNQVILTRDSNNYINTYINGVLKDQFSSSSSLYDNSYALSFGKANHTSNYILSGYLDEIRMIKGSSISAQQVYIDYQKGIESGRIGSSVQETAEKDNWTKLLLHNDGANASTTFTDSSLSKNPVAVNGGAQVSTTQSKFGGSSAYFDGSGDYLSIPSSSDWDFGSGDFTVDFWVNPGTNSSVDLLSKRSGATYQGWTIYSNGTDYYWNATSNGSSWDLGGVTIGSVDSGWTHLAISRNGGSIYLFKNGELTRTVSVSTLSILSNSNPLSVGSANGSLYFQGYLDEVRISKGIARWTDDFTPSTSEHTLKSQISAEGTGSKKIQTGMSQVDGNTVALWNFEETGGSSAYIKDSAGNNHGTPTGTTSVDGISGKARNFDGSTGNYISHSVSRTVSDVTTLDFWIKQTADNGQTTGIMSAGSHRFEISNHISQKRLNYVVWSSGTSAYVAYLDNFTPNYLNQWAHVVGTWDGTTAKLYLNGVLVSQSSSTVTSFSSTPTSYIGRETDYTYSPSGIIDEVTISSVARTADEITNSYRMGRDTRISQTVGDEYTKLLLHSNGTNASTAFTDSSVWKKSVTTNGGAQISTSQSKFGGSSAYFDGSGDYLTVSDSEDFEIANSDFTIDTWAYPTSLPIGGRIVFAKGNSSQFGPYLIQLQSSDGVNGYWYFYSSSNGSSWDVASNALIGTASINTWQHLAVVKTGNTIKLFLNGVKASSDVTLSSQPINNTDSFVVGRIAESVASQEFVGYIDELRISKGIARWTGDFTPPSAEYFSGDFSNVSKVPFYVAADRPGTYLEATAGESNFANNEADSNTGGIWHLDETTGSGAYLKDSSGNEHNGTPTGTTSVEGKIGKGRNFNGTSDYVSIPDFDDTGNSGQEISVFAWVNIPAAQTAKHIVSHWEGTGNIEWVMNTSNLDSGTKLEVTVMNLAGTAYKAYYSNQVITDGKWHYVGFTFNAGTLKLYIDGSEAAVTKWVDNTLTSLGNAAANIMIGADRPSSPRNFLNGTVDEVSIHSNVRTASEIRQAYEIGKRTHKITIDFGASLDSGDLITGPSDTSFTVDATTKGLSEEGEGLYKGDKIIIKENYNGTDYIAQGTVTGITTSTGETSVSSWDEGSIFPSSGFTANATVFKWQREYMDLTGTMDDQIDATNQMTLRVTDGIEGRSVWLDDFESVSNYLTDSDATDNVTSTLGNYIQYRAIISSTDSMVTPYISGISTNYSGGPTLDLIMRHGKWFSGGVKQSFWWVN